MTTAVAEQQKPKRRLPEGWRWVRLGEVCDLLPAKSIARDGDVEVLAITTACLTETGFNPGGVKLARMWSRDVRQAVVSPGEVLIARSNTSELVGRVAVYLGEPPVVVASDLVIRVRPGDHLRSDFLAAFLSSMHLSGYWKERAGGASGSMKKITRTQLLGVPVPLAPLHEQWRIAAMLGEQMAAADRARSAAEAQLEAASTLPRSFLRELFGDSQALHWPLRALGDLANLVNGNAYKPADWSDHGIKIIRIQNLNDRAKPFNYWDGSLDDRVIVQDGSVLLAWSGTPGTSFGAHLWERGLGVLNQHIFRVDIEGNDILPQWLVYAINHRLDDLILKAHGGVGLRHVTKKEVEALRVPVPPPLVQEQMVRRTSERLEHANAARIGLETQLDAINRLPAALLRQAFNGEL